MNARNLFISIWKDEEAKDERAKSEKARRKAKAVALQTRNAVNRFSEGVEKLDHALKEASGGA